MRLPEGRFGAGLVWTSALGLVALLGACGGDMTPDADGSAGDSAARAGAGGGGGGGGAGGAGGNPNDNPANKMDPTPEDLAHPQGWFGNNSISHRVDLPITGQGSVLQAQQLVDQLAGYDPGSLLRCSVSTDAGYQAAIDEIGGVTWGYGVRVLEDLSKPIFMAGLPHAPPPITFASVTATMSGLTISTGTPALPASVAPGANVMGGGAWGSPAMKIGLLRSSRTRTP